MHFLRQAAKEKCGELCVVSLGWDSIPYWVWLFEKCMEPL